MRLQAGVGYLSLVAIVMVVVGAPAGPDSEMARAAEQSAAKTRKVVARVNGEAIYEDQLQPAMEKGLAQLARRGARAENTALAERLQARLLDELIGNLLVYQESKKRTVEDMDGKVEQKRKELEKSHGAGQRMARSPATTAARMGTSRKALEARVRVDEYLREQGVLEPEIPEERIREMYDADPESFSTIEIVRVSHILIGVDERAEADEKERALRRAEQIRGEILAGGDFAAMARAHSDCATAPRGGDLGYIKRGSMPAAFDEVAFALENETVGEVVGTEFGYHVIKAVDRRPSRQVPYEQMRTFLLTYLQGEESKKRLAAHIAELRERSEIQILLQ